MARSPRVVAEDRSQRAEWPLLPPTRLQLPGCNFTIEGASIAGLETWLRVPEWQLGFDLGRCDNGVLGCHTLCLTHAHLDHAGGLAQYLSIRAMQRCPTATVLAPAEACAGLQTMIDAWAALTRSEFDWRLIPMRPGDEYALGKGRVVRAFAAVHVLPSLGYAVVETRRELRPELVGSSREVLIAARAWGAPVEHEVRVVRLAVSGDTMIEGIAQSDALHDAEVAMCETTFVDDQRTAEQARSKGHTHLAELLPVARAFSGRWLVPYHISRIYGASGARRAIERQLPSELQGKVAAFLPG